VLNIISELYLLAFLQLRAVFTTRELNELADTMAERGLRLRKGLEEVLRGLSEGSRGFGSVNENVDDYGEADIEYNAAELRRLKPY
jgi:hypothetical protein